MADTSISWADKVWNPVTGCTKVSEGCRNCYAERMTKRLAGRCGYPAENPFAVTLHPERLEEPLRWKKPSRIFVCSMGDLFHESVPDEYIAGIFGVIAGAPRHTFMVLTKRPERIQPFLKWITRMGGHIQTHRVPEIGACVDALHYCARFLYNSKFFVSEEIEWLPRNLILGTSVEDQRTADERIPLLLQTPAAKRFVSYEPVIGPVNFTTWLTRHKSKTFGDLDVEEYHPLDLIIMGGESGPGARPLHPDWARSARDQCKAAGTAFFFKQWGEWAPVESDEDDFTYEGRDAVVHIDGIFETDKPDEPFIIDRNRDDALMRRTGKKKAGCLLDGVEHKELPERAEGQ